jgi:hypothetical protein
VISRVISYEAEVAVDPARVFPQSLLTVRRDSDEYPTLSLRPQVIPQYVNNGNVLAPDIPSAETPVNTIVPAEVALTQGV